MNTNSNITAKALMLGLVMGLSACGGADPAPAPVAVTPTPAPTPTPVTPTNIDPNNFVCTFDPSKDYIRECTMNYYQAVYGNVTVVDAATINTVAIAAGTYSWVQLYDLVKQIPAAAGNACNNGFNLQGAINAPGVGIWGAFNYGCLNNGYVNFNQAYLARATTQKGGYYGNNAIQTYVYDIVFAIFTANYNYYSTAFSSYVLPYYGYNGYTMPVGVLPTYNGQGGLNLSAGLNYNSGGGLGIGIGFNYQH